MAEAVAGALISAGSALGGALVGAWAVFRADDRRAAREGRAIRRAVVTDVLRWSEACRYAAEDGRRILIDPSGMAWKEIAAPSAAHLPPKLFALLFGLHQEREQSELAYRSLMAGTSRLEPQAFVEMQFMLRRFVICADEFLKEVDTYYRRPWYRKRFPVIRKKDDEGTEDYFAQVTESRVATRLRDEHGYEVTKEGSLETSVARMQSNLDRRDEWLRSSGQLVVEDDEDSDK